MLRIPMILTALRCMDYGRVPEKIECSDTDYDMALGIIRAVSSHNDYVFNVPNEGINEDVRVSEIYSSSVRNVLISMLPKKFNAEGLKAMSVKAEKSLQMVQRQVLRAIEKGQVKEFAKGSYQKIIQCASDVSIVCISMDT